MKLTIIILILTISSVISTKLKSEKIDGYSSVKTCISWAQAPKDDKDTTAYPWIGLGCNGAAKDQHNLEVLLDFTGADRGIIIKNKSIENLKKTIYHSKDVSETFFDRIFTPTADGKKSMINLRNIYNCNISPQNYNIPANQLILQLDDPVDNLTKPVTTLVMRIEYPQIGSHNCGFMWLSTCQNDKSAKNFMNFEANRKKFCTDLEVQVKKDDGKLIKKQDEIYDSIDTYVINCNANIDAIKNNSDIATQKSELEAKQKKNTEDLTKKQADLAAQKKVTEATTKTLADEKAAAAKLQEEINKLNKQMADAAKKIEAAQTKENAELLKMKSLSSETKTLESTGNTYKSEMETLNAGKKPDHVKQLADSKAKYTSLLADYKGIEAGIEKYCNKSSANFDAMNKEHDCTKGTSTKVTADNKKKVKDPINGPAVKNFQ